MKEHLQPVLKLNFKLSNNEKENNIYMHDYGCHNIGIMSKVG
jgi:hypothetical protein